MAHKTSLLEQMRSNPKGNWGINDIEKLCTDYHLRLVPPSKGSHYKVVSPFLNGHLTIPFNRPIKPFYIKELIRMIEAHIKTEESREG